VERKKIFCPSRETDVVTGLGTIYQTSEEHSQLQRQSAAGPTHPFFRGTSQLARPPCYCCILQGIRKYKDEVASDGITSIPSFVKIGQLVQKLKIVNSTNTYMHITVIFACLLSEGQETGCNKWQEFPATGGEQVPWLNARRCIFSLSYTTSH
jgi:hypothetical protein